MGLATNPTSLHKTDVEYKKSDTEEKDSKTEPARFFSEDKDARLLSAAAAEYYKVFSYNVQPDSYQLLQYFHHGPSPKRKERGNQRRSKLSRQLQSHSTKMGHSTAPKRLYYLKKDSDL